MPIKIPPEVKTGLFTAGNVMYWAGKICDIVLEEAENGATQLWARLDPYDNKQCIIHAPNVNNTKEFRRGTAITLPITWRARSLSNGLALVDDALKGDIMFERTTDFHNKIEFSLSGASMGRESWVMGQRVAEHDLETGKRLLQEIKQQWKDIGDESRKAKLEDVIKHHGCIFRLDENGKIKL